MAISIYFYNFAEGSYQSLSTEHILVTKVSQVKIHKRDLT